MFYEGNDQVRMESAVEKVMIPVEIYLSFNLSIVVFENLSLVLPCIKSLFWKSSLTQGTFTD